MQAAMQTDTRLLDVIMDLLAYEQSGPLTSFGKLCDKALALLAVRFAADNESQSTGQNADHSAKAFCGLLQRRLLAFGLIEIATVNGTAHWRVAAQGFIEIDKGHFLIAGPLLFREQAVAWFENAIFPAALSAEGSTHKLYDFPYQFGRGLSLTLLKVTADLELIQQAAADLAVGLFTQAQRQLDLLLTPVALVEKQLVTDEHFTGVTQYSAYRQFDFDSCQWLEINGALIESEGYYRLPYQFGADRDICLKKASGRNKVYEITPRDWGYLLALFICNKSIRWHYHIQAKQLLIPASQFSLLPTLFKRGLLCKTFNWPVLINDHYVITGMTSSEIEVIHDRHPAIRISYSHE